MPPLGVDHRRTVTRQAAGSQEENCLGVLLATVQSGQLTFYEADCSSTTYTAGQSFVEADHLPGFARNEGTTATVVYATFIIPSRTAANGLLIDDPQPTGCKVS